MENTELQNKLDTSIQLILQAQQQIGISVASLQTNIGSHTEAMHAFEVENARLPEKIRSIVREEMKNCPAYIHFDELNARTSEITGVVNIHEEQLKWTKERLDKRSNPPRDKAHWWSPLLVKVCLAAGGVLTAGGLGWGIQCSSGSPKPVSSVASSAQSKQ
jgi:hypothetical protein